MIATRTGEGRKRAKDRGVRFGRPRKLTQHQRQEAIQRLSAGETQMDIARSFNVHHTTIGRLATIFDLGLAPIEKPTVAREKTPLISGMLLQTFTRRNLADWRDWLRK